MLRFVFVFFVVVAGIVPAHAAETRPAPLLAAEAGAVRIRWQVGDVLQPVVLALPAGTTPQITIVQSADLPFAGDLPDPLPTTPIRVLRSGQMQGEHLVVLGIAPVFSHDGTPRALQQIEALVAGAALPGTLAAAPAALSPAPLPPVDMAAAGGLRVTVTRSAMQQISGAALAAAGVDLAAIVPAGVRLARAGIEIPIELFSGEDSRFDTSDTIRFYAPPPGDRYNRNATYHLTFTSTPGARVMRRALAAGSTPLFTTAYEQGSWRFPAHYSARRPGADGDHWFSADMRAGAGLPAATLPFTMPTLLPAAAGTMLLTPDLLADAPTAHVLRLGAAGSSVTRNVASGRGWGAAAALPNSSDATLTLEAGAAPAIALVDLISWSRPVALQLDGRGARFQGDPVARRYQIAGLAADADLYDISDPAAPVRLDLSARPQFEDTSAGRSYLVTGSETLATPMLARFAPNAIAAISGADAVYIAPAELQAGLAPLIAHRQTRGTRAVVIGTDAIYDAWAGGQVSPQAIRAFVRHAYATWNPRPRAIVLVGDGTSDPFDYLRKGANNRNLVPPYLLRISPWQNETACDTCYGLLDGENPLTDPLPDIAIGRLPVNTTAELDRLVAKIIGYETASGSAGWRSRAVLLADDIDSAGDFAQLAENAAALLPAGIAQRNLYFGAPRPGISASKFESSPAASLRRLRSALNSGVGLLLYIGHSNEFQWAFTGAGAEPSYLFGLYEAETLTNSGRNPIVLSMTCLSSAFQTPTFGGRTIDESLVLAPNGAIAVWGPSGFGVAYGHNLLQAGFQRALWAAPPAQAELGALTLAGYRSLFDNDPEDHLDAIQTYVLLGDPLTPARVAPASGVWWPVALPVLQR